ncbi:MAG TPA: hypothetical protein VIS49_04025, partial [Cyclobacteriaceae bacterium]
VNIASRLQTIADPGGIYISESVQQAVHAHSNIKTRYLADVNLKNVGMPIGTYCMVENWLPVPSSDKIKQISKSSRSVTAPIILAIVLITSIFIWWQKNNPLHSTSASIAILPITNLSGDSSKNVLMAGMHSDLRDQIAAIRSLRVPSRTSTAKYQKSTKSIPEIAKELGVDVVLEPDIYQIDDSLRIQVRLIRVFPEEYQIWSESFKTDLGNVFSIYNDIVQAITEELNVTVLNEGNAIPKSKRVDPEAYKAYIEGLGYLYKATPEGINRALNYFNRSLEKDPNYAPAYTGIAMVYGFRSQMGLISAYEAAPYVQEATAKALSLGSDHPEIHYLLAITNTWGNWNWEEAKKEFEITLNMNPNNAEARAHYAHYLNILNRSNDAESQMNKALELETDNWLVQALYGMYLNHARAYPKALSRLNKLLENDPSNTIALAALWTIYHNMGQYDKALETAKVLYSERREYRAVEMLITGNQEGGYKVAMERVAEAFIEKMDTTYFAHWQIATLYTRAGNQNKALEWLQKAYEAHDPNMPYISCDPIFDKIVDHPGFQIILSKMELKRGSE